MRYIICDDCHTQQPYYGHGICRACYSRRWRQMHPEKHGEYERRRRQKLGFQYVEMERKRNQTSKRKEWKRNYYLTHKEYFAQKQREYRVRNKDKSNARWAKWYKENPDKVRLKCMINDQHRRMRELNLPATLTKEQWQAIKSAYKNKCAYCGKYSKRLCQDHFIPITKGGGYVPDNIVPACRRCNSSKCDRSAPKDAPIRLMI